MTTYYSDNRIGFCTRNEIPAVRPKLQNDVNRQFGQKKSLFSDCWRSVDSPASSPSQLAE
jgi:hypothetical protein